MLIFTELSYMPKEAVVRLKNNLCINEDESELFDMIVFQNKSSQQIADRLHKSTRTIFRMMNKLKIKVINELEYERSVTIKS